MAVLGLIIALATGAFVVAAFLSASDPATLNLFGVSASTTVGRLVALGALAGLLFMLGLAMLFGGVGRAARRRRETKQVVVTSRTEAEELRLENERLARELEQRQAAPGGAAVVEHRVVDDTHSGDVGDSGAVLTSGDLAADRGTGADGYVPRHGDDTYNPPVAYPEEPAAVREDVQTRSSTGPDGR
jgi:hypothetical protein